MWESKALNLEKTLRSIKHGHHLLFFVFGGRHPYRDRLCERAVEIYVRKSRFNVTVTNKNTSAERFDFETW